MARPWTWLGVASGLAMAGSPSLPCGEPQPVARCRGILAPLRGMRDRPGGWSCLGVPEVVALLAPMLGAIVARLIPTYPEPRAFWSGLVVQLALLAAPVAMLLRRQSPAVIGLGRRGWRGSVLLGGAYCLVYLILLVAAARHGLTTSHFDVARRQLGIVAVLALYLPFWGLAEGVWMAYLLALAQRTLIGPGPLTWRALGIAALWFGVLHAVVQIVLYQQPPTVAASYVLVGLLLVIAGSIHRLAGNAWGMVLFWTVSNF